MLIFHISKFRKNVEFYLRKITFKEVFKFDRSTTPLACIAYHRGAVENNGIFPC